MLKVHNGAHFTPLITEEVRQLCYIIPPQLLLQSRNSIYKLSHSLMKPTELHRLQTAYRNTSSKTKPKAVSCPERFLLIGPLLLQRVDVTHDFTTYTPRMKPVSQCLTSICASLSMYVASSGLAQATNQNRADFCGGNLIETKTSLTHLGFVFAH